MKAIRVNKPNEIEIVDIPMEKIEKEDEILVKIKAAGICGSDVSIYLGKSPVATYPRIMGHEMTGIVEEIGEKVTKFKKGDHVIIKQTESCGVCYACTHGRENVCRDLKVRGVTIEGGYREYLTVSENSAYKISKKLDLKTAVLIEPFTIAFQAFSRGRLKEDDVLLVYGAGALGASLIRLAKSFGCTIIAVDVSEEKLEQARRLGAHHVLNGKDEKLKEKIKELTEEYGPTISVDAVCNPKSVEFLIDITGNAGRVVLMGFSKEPSEIPQFKITAKELDVVGSRLQFNNFEKVIELFENKSLDPSDTISHVFDFTDIEKAFEVVKTGNFTKIILNFGN